MKKEEILVIGAFVLLFVVGWILSIVIAKSDLDPWIKFILLK